MKREKTGTEVLGSRLFADPSVLPRWLDKLPVVAAEQLRLLRKDRPDATPEQLRAALHSDFSLRPLVIHDLQSIRIELPRRDYLNEYRSWMSGHLAEAVVPYSGSVLLWKARLQNPFEFGFPGQVGPSAARLRTFLDGKDFDWFEEKVETELRSARTMLELVASGVAVLQEKAENAVDRVADRMLSEE